MRRDAPHCKCCTRCVVTEEIVRHDGILYKELYEYVRRDAKSLRHDARAPGDFGCSSAMTDHGLRHDGLYTYTVLKGYTSGCVMTQLMVRHDARSPGCQIFFLITHFENLYSLH